MNRLLLIALSIVLFSSCKKDKEAAAIPSEVRPAYEEFCAQAKSRNITLNFKYLKEIVLQGDIPQSQDETISGLDAAGYYDRSTKKIYLDTTGVDYKRHKEALIFHELGHALLHREHRDDLFTDNETPVSIMHWQLMAPLNTMTSAYYFDEMFNTSTPYPYWVKEWK